MSSVIDCIRTVGRGERGRKPLSYDQAYLVMDEYLAGSVDDDQMAMLLMLIRVQNETQAEIAGFVRAFQSRLPNLNAYVDWPCYAGKRLSAGKPWHLLAARILASNGYKILMHGFKEATNERLHAEDYLDSLDIVKAQSLDEARVLLDSQNICYLPLEVFAPQAKTMLAWKSRYGLRTPINTVVRALNPGGGKIGVRGSYHPGFQQLHANIEHEVGLHAHSVISFKGVSGESEYNPKVSQTVWHSSAQGVTEHYWPEQYDEQLSVIGHCPFDTPSEQQVLMANTVVRTISALLFTENNDASVSLIEAKKMWQQYLNNRND